MTPLHHLVMQSMLQILTDFQQRLWEGHGKSKLPREMELWWAGCQGSSLGISPFHTWLRTKTTSGHETEDSRDRLLCTESRHRAKKQPF